MLRHFAKLGEMSVFGLKALAMVFTPPFEFQYFLGQIEDLGSASAGLISAAASRSVW